MLMTLKGSCSPLVRNDFSQAEGFDIGCSLKS